MKLTWSRSQKNIKADELLEMRRTRYVVVIPDNKQFLRYEKEKSASSLVPSQSHETKIMRGHIVSRVIHPVVGCLMIFCRWVSASHLNGELGEVKVATYDDGVIFRVEVHFEKKGSKSTLVKPENLRIVFDLPKR